MTQGTFSGGPDHQSMLSKGVPTVKVCELCADGRNSFNLGVNFLELYNNTQGIKPPACMDNDGRLFEEVQPAVQALADCIKSAIGELAKLRVRHYLVYNEREKAEQLAIVRQRLRAGGAADSMIDRIFQTMDTVTAVPCSASLEKIRTLNMGALVGEQGTTTDQEFNAFLGRTVENLRAAINPESDDTIYLVAQQEGCVVVGAETYEKIIARSNLLNLQLKVGCHPLFHRHPVHQGRHLEWGQQYSQHWHTNLRHRHPVHQDRH